MGSATKELDRIFSEQKRYGKIGVSLGQGYWESLNTTQRDNLLIRARVRINKPSDQILFDGLPKPFQGIINRRASNVTLNPKIDKEQELTTRKKVYGDFKNKSKSARVEAVRQRLAIVRKPSPSAFKLPEYTELDYEAWHDKVHDTEWRLEDAYDSGIFPEDYDWDSLDFQLVNKPWKARSGFERQKLRPYYQKMMSGELSWQKDPTHYTSGKLPQEARTYIKPGFSSHITTDARVPTDPDAYYEVHPKDIADKETNVSQMDLDDPSKYGKSVRIQAVRQRLAFKPPEESFGMIDPDVFEEKTNPKGNKRIPPSRQRMQWLGPMGIPTRTSPFAKDMLKKNKKQSYKPDPITKKRHKIKSEGLTEGYIDKYNLAKQKSARIQMARERLGAVGKISNLNDKMISKARYKGKDFPQVSKGMGSGAFLTPDGTFVGTNDHAQTVLDTDYKYNKFVTEKGGSYSRATTQWLRDSGAYRLRGIYPDYTKNRSLSGLHIEGYTEPTKQQIKQLTKLRDQVGSENVDWAGVDITEKLGLGIKKPQERTHTEMMGAKLRQRLGAVGKADVAPERVISTKNPSYDTSRTTEKHGASVYIEGTGEPSPLEGRGTHSQTELQKRTFNRIIKPKPKSKKPSDFKTQEEKVNYLKEQRMLNKQQSDDDYERMESQYISEDAINKNKWAKLRQRIGAVGMPKDFGKKKKKKPKFDLSSHERAKEVEDFIMKTKDMKFNQEESDALKEYRLRGTKIRPKKRKRNV